METLGAARLAKEIPAQRAVAAIVPREEITAVLRDPEGSPELSLQIVEDAGEPSVIAMTWSRDELARVLEGANGDKVVLTFDRDELSQAIGEVEAHGLRERALVFAVVATGALGSGAAIANAMPTNDDQGPAVTSVAPAVFPVVASTAPAAPVADSTTDASSAAGYTAVEATTGSIVTDASSAAGYASPAEPGASAGVTDVSSAGGYTAATDTASSGALLTDVSSAGGYTAATDTASSGGVLTDVSSAGGYTAAATDTAGLPGAMLTDASSSGGYGTVEETGSSGQFLGISQSDVTGGLVAAGAILLTITGATFASRSTRPARPA